MSMLRWARAAMVAAGLLVLGGMPARADILFSDLGPGDSYNTGDGYTVSGAGSGAGGAFSSGAEFTAAATGALVEIDAAFFGVQGSMLFNLSLFADDGTGHPGALLESIQNIGPAQTPPGSVLSISSALHPTLTAGDNYWLIASPTDSTDWVAWNLTSPTVSGTLYQSDNGTVGIIPDTALPAFRLISGAVPEPSSLSLGVLGVVALAGIARRRRAARA